MALFAAGAALGLLLALGATRLLQSLLFEVSATDPITYIGVVALLGASALAATYFPARRASRVDPLTALRYD